MTDYCLQNADEAEFDGLMLLTGLGVEMTDDEGNVAIVPSTYEVLMDKIGPITVPDPTGKTDKKGNVLTITYPEYYSNLRLLFEPSEEQVTALSAYAIDPSQPQYRVWA